MSSFGLEKTESRESSHDDLCVVSSSRSGKSCLL